MSHDLGVRSAAAMAILAATVMGCQGPPGDLAVSGNLAPPPVSDRELPLRPWVPEVQPLPGREGKPPHVASLTLRAAIRQALTYNPALKAAFAEINAKAADAAQASYKPNPHLLFELEDFAGTNAASGFKSAQETLQISQVLELGDKRLARLRAAEAHTSLSAWDFEVTRLTVAGQAAAAFVEVLASQERGKVLEDLVSVATKTEETVNLRVKAGQASSIEADRAKIVVAQARALLEAERARLAAAKDRLAALWGGRGTNFGTAAGRLAVRRHVPSLESVTARLERNPTLARWADEIGQRYTVLHLEYSKSIPDVTAGLGIRRLNETDSTALVASVSLPLQVFDRNEGAIAAAGRRIVKAQFDQQAARTQLMGTLVGALGDLTVAAGQIQRLERDILPAAQSAFERTQLGYKEGKFDLVSVLDTQRTLFQTRLDLINARAQFEAARVNVETLLGQDLNGL